MLSNSMIISPDRYVDGIAIPLELIEFAFLALFWLTYVALGACGRGEVQSPLACLCGPGLMHFFLTTQDPPVFVA